MAGRATPVLLRQALFLASRSLQAAGAATSSARQHLSLVQQALYVAHASRGGLQLPVRLPWAARGWSSAAQQVEQEAISTADLHITDAAVQRMQELLAQSPGEPLKLRIVVEGGGCSGFTYNFALDSHTDANDRVFQKDGATVVCDAVSFEFIKGSKVDYTTDIIKSAFEVVANPNASQSCGCGSSFAPKL